MSHFQKQQSVQVIAGQDELFGINQNVKVTTINMTPKLMKLHKDLLSVLDKQGAIYDEPQYLNDGYRAHATVQKSKRLNIGTKVYIDEITIVDMYPDGDIRKRRVLKTIKLAQL